MATRKTLKTGKKARAKVSPLRKKKTRLAYYLGKGLSIKDARTLAKVDDVSFGLMRSDPEFEDFLQRCSLQYERELTEYIEESASLGTWQAAAWLLERKFPEKYGKKDMVKHEYTIKIQNFQRIVLDAINKESPELKCKVIQALRNIDTRETTKLLSAPQEDSLFDEDVHEAEYVDM